MPHEKEIVKEKTDPEQMSWTEEQQRVIDARDRSLLVSAAAGSGKTAVLVERILALITQGEHPMNVDELLVVTFTNAAAAEMRERILAAIAKEADARPKDMHLQRQMTLIHNAQITTIDSFCLYVVSNHFHRIDLEPGFRIADETELRLLREDVCDAMLEDFYAKKDPSFLRLADGYTGAKNDRKLRDMILELYRFAQSYPWPDEWLDICVAQYYIKDEAELEEKDWVREYLSYLHSRVESNIVRWEEELALTRLPDGLEKYDGVIRDDIEQLQSLLPCEHIREWQEALDRIDWKGLPGSPGKEASIEKKDEFQKSRKRLKNWVNDLLEKDFGSDIDIMIADLNKTGTMVETLVSLAKAFAACFAQEKARKNIVDFSDLEHFALRILVDPETKEPTETAGEYRAQFREVMIDEYQDSNYLQEEILSAVSGIPEGRQNLFMVGDVKQSIYRFRLARPELFMKKYETFSSEESPTQRIDLHKNFRSTPEVVDTVNAIFSQIMGQDLGNVEYNEEAALYPGRECQREEGHRSKCILVEEKEGEDKKITEAAAIARQIRKMTEEGTSQREYRDIVILLRSLKDWSRAFVTAFEREGVPLIVSTQTGYFEAQEVQVILSMLRVLDNPRQDIPLAALMRSPIGGFTDAEMTMIRAEEEELPFFADVEKLAEQSETELGMKTACFWKMLYDFRTRVPYTPIHTLIQQIYDETGYRDLAASMPAGRQRAANLDMLVEKAVAYEKTSFHGLFDFVRYIDRIIRYELDFGEAETVSERENAVRLMTIHASKGLEFPVVFAAGMSKQFNLKDATASMIFHPQYGVGIQYCDPDRRVKKDTLIRRAFSVEAKKESLGEELRVLYVALTRAQDTLIVTGMKKEEELPQAADAKPYEKLPFFVRMDAKSPLDWVLAALARSEGTVDFAFDTEESRTRRGVDRQIRAAARREALLAQLEDVDETVLADLSDRFSWTYPHPQSGLKQKISVSEIKHRAMEDAKETLEEEEEGTEWFPEENPIPYIPKFVKDREENIGALRGTAFHRLMECLPFSNMPAFASPDEAAEWSRETLASLCAAGRMEQDEAGLVEPEQIARFLMTGAAGRMREAAEGGRLVREQPFVLLVPAEQVEPGAGEEEQVLIQGIIDVFWEEDDGIVLLDYKTDRVKRPEDLITRYQAQLQFYAEALDRRFMPKQVKEVLIYSFCLDTMIPVPIEGRISAAEGV